MNLYNYTVSLAEHQTRTRVRSPEKALHLAYPNFLWTFKQRHADSSFEYTATVKGQTVSAFIRETRD